MAIVSHWTGSLARDPVVYDTESPPITPVSAAVGFANSIGNWLFAIVSWRQDAGFAGSLLYPSTVTVSDDAHNFWIPVTVSQPNAGVIRTSVWMAPAARRVQRVFASPTAYQSAMGITVFEVTADVPWYSIAAVATTAVNQGTSITLSSAPPAGLFAFAAITYDNDSATVTPAGAGWTSTGAGAVVSNGNDHTGDLTQIIYYTTSTAGGTITLSASSGTTMDWAEVIVTVHGVSDAIVFPYAQPLENWPVLITEIASGPVLNKNPAMLNGTTDWSPDGHTTVFAVNWPVWNPFPQYQTLINQTLLLAPDGLSAQSSVGSGLQPVSVTTLYSALAYVYKTQLGPSTTYVGINYYDISSVYITTVKSPSVTIQAGTWTQLQFTNPQAPPANAAFGSVVVTSPANSGNIGISDLVYVGYASFGPADGYQGLPPDQLAWTDFSGRQFSQSAISIERGIQYEQQALEAGTMSLTLADNDYQVMFANVLSSFWPNIGDTDVPVRLRAVNPASATPYTVLFSGFTDDVDFGYDNQTRYSWTTITASDGWSRLTQQLLPAAQEEILEDNPGNFFPCSQSGLNLAPGAVTPVVAQPGAIGSSGASASFGQTGISLAGNPGAGCWQSSGASSLGNVGLALTFFPPSPISIGSSTTVEFWMSPVSTTQPASILTVCTCWARKGQMWTVSIDQSTGHASVSVYDRATGAATTTSLGSWNYLSAQNAPLAWFFAVTFTQSSLTVTTHTGGTFNTTTVGCNFAQAIAGFSWGGNAGLGYYPNTGGFLGMMNIAVANIALYGYTVPAARVYQHYNTALNAAPAEQDTWRLARVAGYSGFTPTLGIKQLPSSNLAADQDIITPVTDTNGQVVSSYLTNIASTTLAAMLVDGPGTLQYRRRLEWYDRQFPQWITGDSPSVALNPNTLSNQNSTTGWQTQAGATLASSTAAAGVAAVFNPYSGVFHGDGITSTPTIFTGLSLSPVTPGQWYEATTWLYTPQGWSSGMVVSVGWKTSGGGFISQGGSSLGVGAIAAGSLAWGTSGPQQAPPTAAFAEIIIAATGTPPIGTLFYVASAQLQNVPLIYVTASGAHSPSYEAPYTVDVKLSSDRAQLFNQAIVTQFGTNTQTTFRGTDIVFSPTSGIIVNIQNQPSVNLRGAVPFTSTSYLDNTVQAKPYYNYLPSIEDYANWIVETLGSPLFRPLTVTITPAATPQSLITALEAEVGDTFTFRRRQLSVPEVEILTYCSKLSHSIDISAGTWNTAYELSPYQQGTILQCDDTVAGCITGGNLLGW